MAGPTQTIETVTGESERDEALAAWDTIQMSETTAEEKHDLNIKVENAIRNSTEYAQKVDKMVDEPEIYGISPDDAESFTAWLRERAEKASAEPNPEAEEAIERSQQARLETAREVSSSPQEYDVQLDRKRLEDMSLEELMGEMFTRFSNLMDSFQGGLGGLFSEVFTPDQIEKIRVDIDTAVDKEYDVDSENNRSAEFVAAALNIPARKDVPSLLTSMIHTPDFIYSESKDDFYNEENLKVGDVLFFKEGENRRPNLCAVISQVSPVLEMTYMTEDGEIYAEPITDSELFNEQWLGFMRIPESKQTNINQ